MVSIVDFNELTAIAKLEFDLYLTEFVSVNSMYITIRGNKGKTLSTQCRTQKAQILASLQTLKLLDRLNNPDDIVSFSASYDFHCKEKKIYTKSRDLKKFDVSNLIKSVEDSICDYLGIDDSKCYKIESEKHILSDADLDKVLEVEAEYKLSINLVFYS